MGKRKKAYKNFKLIIDKDSNNIKAYLYLGRVVRDGGNPKKALEIHNHIENIGAKILFEDKTLIIVEFSGTPSEISSLIKKMKGRFKRLFVTTDCNGLLLKATELSEKLTSSGLPNTPLDSISEGIITIKKELTKGSVGIIFGSHYIAKEIFDEFEISFDTGII